MVKCRVKPWSLMDYFYTNVHWTDLILYTKIQALFKVSVFTIKEAETIIECILPTENSASM